MTMEARAGEQEALLAHMIRASDRPTAPRRLLATLDDG
jgi:hypothetical protein